MGIMMAKDRTHAPDTSRTGAGSNTEQVAGKTTRVLSEGRGGASAPGRPKSTQPTVEAHDNESKGAAPAPRWRAAAQPMVESQDQSKGAAPATGRGAPTPEGMAGPQEAGTGSGSADLVTMLLGWLTSSDLATVVAKVIVVPSNKPTILASSKLSQLFEAMVTHAHATDLDAVGACRLMLEKLGPVPQDKAVSNTQWRTTARVADALKRAQSDGAAHLETLISPTPSGTQLGTRRSTAMSLDQILLRLEDLRGVIGVAIDPAHTATEAKKSPAAAFDPTKPDNELARITKMGFHSVRVELDVPKPLVATKTFLGQIVAYNAQQKTAATKLSVDLLVNFSGSIDNPAFGLDATEINADSKTDDKTHPTAYQRAYALTVGNDMVDKEVPKWKGFNQDVATQVQVLRDHLNKSTDTLSQDAQRKIATLASTILGGAVEDYMTRFTTPLSLGDVGTAFGNAAADLVNPLITSIGLDPSLTSVELGNEPEKQWHTPHVHMVDKQQAIDTDIILASMRAFQAATATVPGLGAKVVPAASEWDPATEQEMIKNLNAKIVADPDFSIDLIADAVERSGWGIALKAYANGGLSTKTPIPLSVHIYNSPELARALIAVIARVATSHQQTDPNFFFDVSITELQIDGVTHNKPTEAALAHGIVDLGIAVMDAAAQCPKQLKIGQLIAFSYHDTGNEDGQHFGLRGNNELATLIGEPTPQ